MASAARRMFEARHVDPKAVVVPAGFTVEVAATDMNNPSTILFDEAGHMFIAEMGSPSGTAYAPGRILRLREDGSTTVVADGFEGSITGMAFREGAFYVIEHAVSGRIYWVGEDGAKFLILDGLPGGGDHPTSDIVTAHSERLYFGQGTRTNSGVVGPDNADWVRRHPELHDIPSSDITLTGRNFHSENLLGEGTVWTGAFQPFGVGEYDGEPIPGQMKSSGAILRMAEDGAELEVFASGFRDIRGISVHADGRIFCTEIGMQDRGSRRIAGGMEYLWHVQHGTWYGWPDFEGGLPVTDPAFKPEDDIQPEFLTRDHPGTPPKPIASFPAGSGLAKFEFNRSPLFGDQDLAYVALSGGMRPASADEGLGHNVVGVDTLTGEVRDFATNAHPGPASLHNSGGLERPSAVRFDRTGEIMYVIDLGVVEADPSGGLRTLPGTGVIWRIRPEDIA